MRPRSLGIVTLALTLTLALWPSLTLGASATSDGLLDEGVRRFRARDFAGALPLLERASVREPQDGDLALLVGIARYRTGRLDDALAPLRTAAASTDEETSAGARLFLGLIAVERGDADDARGLLQSAAESSSPPLAASGTSLLHRSTPRTLGLTLLVRPEFDSNVALLPSTPVAGAAAAQSDGDLLVLASLTLRPLRSIDLTVAETASYRQQLSLTSYDFFANLLGARWAWRGSSDRISVESGFELLLLGGSLYSLGGVGQASWRRALWRELGVALGEAVRYRDYAAIDFAGFTGPSSSTTLEVSWGTAERPLELALGYQLVREWTADATFTALGHGPELRARARLGPRVEALLSAWWLLRGFDTPDPGLGPRSDSQVGVGLSLAIELARWLGLLAGGSLLHNSSTVSSYEYAKWTVHAGLAVSWAGP